MLEDLYPRVAGRFRSLPLLGPRAEDFVQWLAACGYRTVTRRNMLWTFPRIDRWLRRHGVQQLAEIDPAVLAQCRTVFFRRNGQPSATVRALGRYLTARGLIRAQCPESLTPSEHLVAEYAHYLETARGIAPVSIARQRVTAIRFLKHVRYDAHPARLGSITGNDIEALIRDRAQEVQRTSLRIFIGDLRGFLRFLAMRVEALSTFAPHIDTPRIYTQEQLPRALPWETVQALLASIDRRTACGRRDYAMLFLMATYGLRIGEVAALTLDDIQWRQGQLSVLQSKTKGRLLLPLTDQAGAVLIEYLRTARPPGVPFRHVFVNSRAPICPITAGAVTSAFRHRVRRSGLKIPFTGAHCLRHSYALHLLRRGMSLKLIGDLLGHRDAESTCIYLRLATEDLRQVPLAVPPATLVSPGTEVRSWA